MRRFSWSSHTHDRKKTRRGLTPPRLVLRAHALRVAQGRWLVELPGLVGLLDGEAGTAGVAGVAGFAGVAGPPPVLGTAGVARVAGTAGVAGVTGRLSRPTASPRKWVARCALTIALAVSEACEFGMSCAASSAGKDTAAASSMSLRSMCDLLLEVLQRPQLEPP